MTTILVVDKEGCGGGLSRGHHDSQDCATVLIPKQFHEQ